MPVVFTKKHTQKASQSPSQDKPKSKKSPQSVFVNIKNVIKINKYFVNGIEKTREDTKQGKRAFCQYIRTDKKQQRKKKIKHTPRPEHQKKRKKAFFLFSNKHTSHNFPKSVI